MDGLRNLFSRFIYCLTAAQFSLVSAAVYGGQLPEYILLLSFVLPLAIAAVFGVSTVERLAFALAISSLAGLPDSGGQFFSINDPSASIGPVGTFTLIALFFAAKRLTEGQYDFQFIACLAIIPVVGFILSLLIADKVETLIFSEFAKFPVFLVFLFYALTRRPPEKWARQMIAPLTFTVLGVGAFSLMFLDLGYSYGGARYLYLPASIILIPILCWFWADRILLFLLMVIAALVAVGLVQASARLVVLIVLGLAGYVGRRAGLAPAAFAATVIVAAGIVAFPFLPDGLRFKMSSLVLLVSGAHFTLGDTFFFTSAGNMYAEARTVLHVVLINWLTPVGPGFAVPDLFGELSLANPYAYPESAFHQGAFFPLHLGAFYLFLWYGVFVALFLKRMGVAIFLVTFALTGTTYKPLLFAAAFLTDRRVWFPSRRGVRRSGTS